MTARPVRALIVEDCEEDALLVEAAMRRGGYAPVFERVETADAMRASLERGRFDLVLADFYLPCFSARAALQVLHETGLDIPFIVVTGATTEEDAVTAMGAGAQDYVTKGNLARLVPAVDRELRDAATRQEHRRAERDLKASEALLRRVTENTLDIVGQIDLDGKLQFITPSAKLVLGHPAEEMLGKSVFSFVHPDDRERGEFDFNESLRAGRASRGDFRFLHAGGRDVWIEIAGNPLFDEAGQPCGGVFVGRDISERRRAEERLGLLTTALEAADNGIIITDRTGIIQWCNPAFCRLSGYSVAESVGQTPRILKSGRQDRAYYDGLWRTVLNGQVWHGELVNQRKDGTVFTEEMTITPVRAEGKEITHFIAIKQDITEKRGLEARYLHAQRMESIGVLAGGIAHDFNNLLSVINGHAEIVLDDLTADDARRSELEAILKAGEKAAGLTRQLLAFSRKQVLAPRFLDLNTLVSDSEKMLRRVVGEDVQLSIQLAPEPCVVSADPGQLDQVLMNLVVNARQAMPGGGHLQIDVRQAHVDADAARLHSLATAGPHAALSVIDSGAGMTAEVCEHVFEPFFTTKAQGEGTGLGLSVVFGIVQQSGGSVDVTSQVGAGTTFRVMLPLSERSADRSAPEAPASISGPRRGTILLVEDDVDVRQLTRSTLQRAGYRVLETLSPGDACLIAEDRSEHIDLLLTDVVMPLMSGPRLAERLEILRPGLPTLFMSGYIKEHYEAGERPIRPELLLQKPFTTAGLLEKVASLIGQRGPVAPDRADPRRTQRS